jgi:hypothetical protein
MINNLNINNYNTNIEQRPIFNNINRGFNINQYSTNLNTNINNFEQQRSNRNKNGHVVSKGTNDVYYCGQKTLFACGCCDGSCGPDNGCCCKACMEYNCDVYNAPANSLINCKGRLATFLGGNFYCLAEYISKSSLFNKAKNIKCQFPGKPCQDCEKLTKNIAGYWSQEKISRLRK